MAQIYFYLKTNKNHKSAEAKNKKEFIHLNTDRKTFNKDIDDIHINFNNILTVHGEDINNVSVIDQIHVVNTNGHLIKFIHTPCIEIQMVAVKEKANSIKFITFPDRTVQDYAIKQNGYLIRHINHPDKLLCTEAIYQNPDSIKYIDTKLYPSLYNLSILLSN